jgi:hypothetical protein
VIRSGVHTIIVLAPEHSTSSLDASHIKVLYGRDPAVVGPKDLCGGEILDAAPRKIWHVA